MAKSKKQVSPVSFYDRFPTWLIVIVPLLLLAALVILFVQTNPIQVATTDLPPIENLSIQRIELPEPNHIIVHVTNAGPDPVEIAQILVDDAYWQFEIEPSGMTLDRLESTRIHLSYPWVATEPHEIVIVTSSGTTFSGEIELAVQSPALDLKQFLAYGLVGFYIGIIPIGLGLLWYPAMRKLSRRGMGFILSLTVGLLFFLLVDTLLEGFEVAEELPGVYQGIPLTLFIAVLTWLAITAIGSRKSVADRDTKQGRMFIALLIAIGIGFHNLGEGLVVGAAFALGEAALGSFLVIGFILHNITEGVGIAAPVVRDKASIRFFIWLLLIAGAPAILGTWIGGFAFSPLLAVIFLAIGSGAIWQVIYEVGLLIQRDAKKAGSQLIDWVNVSGLLTGITVMYLTAFLVKF